MKTKKIILAVLFITLALAAGVFIYGYTLLGDINYKEISNKNEDLGITPTPTPKTKEKQKVEKVTNILLFGLDRRNPDQESRSDSIMVVSLNGKYKRIKITSLMRDMYVAIPGKEKNRINTAFTYGPQFAIKTVNTNFGLDVRDYAAVDFFGLEKMIDQVGGIDINVKSYEVKELNKRVAEVSKLEGDKNPVYVKKAGVQTLDGRQSVAYARIRKVGNADYERTSRQRTVLNALYQKVKSQGIAKLPATISKLLPYVETSLTRTEILRLALEAANYNTTSLDQFRLPVDGGFTEKTVKGMDVLVPDIELNKKLLQQFIYEIK